MYFFKIELLKKQLVDRGLTEKQTYSYILIYVALFTIAIETMGYYPYKWPSHWNYLSSIINIIIPILGTVIIFRANGGISGVQFAARYFSIGLVATIRFVIFLIPIMVVLMIYWYFSNDFHSNISMTGQDVALSSGWCALLYAYIAKNVRAVDHAHLATQVE